MITTDMAAMKTSLRACHSLRLPQSSYPGIPATNLQLRAAINQIMVTCLTVTILLLHRSRHLPEHRMVKIPLSQPRHHQICRQSYLTYQLVQMIWSVGTTISMRVSGRLLRPHPSIVTEVYIKILALWAFHSLSEIFFLTGILKTTGIANQSAISASADSLLHMWRFSSSMRWWSKPGLNASKLIQHPWIQRWLFQTAKAKTNCTLNCSCTHCGKHYASASALFAHVEKEHTKTEPSTPKSGSPDKAIAANDNGERRLNIDGSMDIGELEFQIYDRPPNIAQRNPRYRPKMSFGLRSSKVPHGTYW